MTNGSLHLTPQPFFLDATPGRRFCLYYPPVGSCRGSVLYVPPFAEEMNRSRRTVSLQALDLARCGYAVLLIDLFGCGDSDGDFADARWQVWLKDLAAAVDWLKKTVSAPVSLWGLRLGVPLMMDYARTSDETFQHFILWQPVPAGQQYLTQFLRLRLAGEMLSGSVAQTSVKDLRQELVAGNCLEVAGYRIAPELAASVDDINLSGLAGAGGMCHWFEVGQSDKPVSPAGTKVMATWMERGAQVTTHRITGEMFWQSPEITVCQDLIDATTGLLIHGI